jgi:signal transduction histidine kinase
VAAYAPIGVSEVVGALDIVWPAEPFLATAEPVRTRATLTTIGLLCLLFAALLAVVNRADQIIARRTGALSRLNDELRQSELVRAELSDMIVHDLRSPLTAVMLDLDLLTRASGGLDPRLVRTLDRARQSSAGMMSMIENILTVGKMESGDLHTHPQAVRLAPIIDEVLRELEALFTVRNLTTHVSVPPDAIAYVDADLVRRVFHNLVSNAIRHSPQGGSVTVAVEPTTEAVAVTVGDDGPGVPETLRDRVFQKYVQRSDRGAGGATRGVGLGLAFCKLAVEAHGGRIWVDGPPGEGAKFHFTLPRPAAEM